MIATTTIAMLALLFGVALLSVATYLTLRPGPKGSSFGWAVVAGLALAILAMGAAIRGADSGGLTAALLLLVTVVLAGVLGTLSVRPGDEPVAEGRGLSAVGRGLAWLALVGLPPTLGFHARVTLYHALLATGWEWPMLFVMAASVVLLGAGLKDLRSLSGGGPRGPRAASVLALIALTVLLGFYPYLWLLAEAVTSRLAGPG